MQITWRVEFFGGLRASHGDRVLTHFETRKTAALFACLAFSPGRVYAREMLAEQLWPDEPDASRDRLRQALSALRQALELPNVTQGNILIADRAEVYLNPEILTTDIAEFERLRITAVQATSREQRADALVKAIALYKGELLPGFYEDWVLRERERLAEAFQDALQQAGRVLAEIGSHAEAIGFARRAVAADPLREDIQADLMRYYVAVDRPADALRQYREAERALREELGIAPSTPLRVLQAEIQERAARTFSSPQTATSIVQAESLGAEGGGVPLTSSFYLARPTDEAFMTAISRRDSIVLVKGARQIGKTSLMARGLQQAREAGLRVVLTDLQKLSGAQMETADALFFSLAETIAEELRLEVTPETVWNSRRSWNVNFERFLRREVLEQTEVPLVWAIDEVDRLFEHAYRADVFGLFRAWHNERALNPDAPWGKLTLALSYATEAHLFIADLNQSPFNVGTRLLLDDFTRGEVVEMNRRYHAPLQGEAALNRYYALVGGHPYLVRRGLCALTEQGMTPDALEEVAEREDGPFGDHLRRMLTSLRQDAGLCEAVRALLQGAALPTSESYYRLHSAGIIVGESPTKARFRCDLYRNYLASHLS